MQENLEEEAMVLSLQVSGQKQKSLWTASVTSKTF